MAVRLSDLGRRERSTHSVRLLTPLGLYPAQDVHFPECKYFASEDLCFSVSTRSQKALDEPITEMMYLSVSETKAYGSIVLASIFDGNSAFYPFPTSYGLICNIPSIGCELPAEEVRELVGRQLLIDIENASAPSNGYRPWWFGFEGVPLPPIVGGPRYSLHDDLVDYELAHRLFASINVEDALALRAISTLITASMLWNHRFFSEVAMNTLFISMEACYRMVLRELRGRGVEEPTAKDAATFVHETFESHLNIPESERHEKFFEYDYFTRVTSFHPESRHGTFQHPEMMADDYYDLADSLKTLLRYLLVGYLDPREHVQDPLESE